MSGAIVNRDRAGSPAPMRRAKPYGLHLSGFRDSYLLVDAMFRRFLEIVMAPTEMLRSLRAS